MQRKRGRRDEPNLVVLKYTPQWSVFSSDSFDARAYTEAKEVGPDLCKAFIMRADRKVYEGVVLSRSVQKMLGHLSLVSVFNLLVPVVSANAPL